jgi:hypothetical protein
METVLQDCHLLLTRWYFFLLFFVKDDKICVHNDRSESNSLVSVYITKLRINMVMTFMKNQGCVFDIPNKNFVRIC